MSVQDKEKTRRFLQLQFQDYYRNNSARIDVPDKVFSREFAMERFDYQWRCYGNEQKPDGTKRTGCRRSGRSYSQLESCPYCGSQSIDNTRWTRHVGFRNKDVLLKEIQKTVPHSVYHSAAYYSAPTASIMTEKGWSGADLIFDIDADHLDAACIMDHDIWYCKTPGCGLRGAGSPPEDGCPSCGKTSFSVLSWLCDDCLDNAKKQTMKLYDDFLVDDFGISPEHIRINYSGHRGYHVRVTDPRLLKLGSRARIEIVHYIMGMGLKTDRKGRSGRDSVTVPSRNSHGWAGMVADAMIEFIRNIESYSGDERWVQIISKNKTGAIEGLLSNPPLLSSKIKGVGPKSWREIIDVATSAYGGKIDVPVTHDVHRVIRLIGSLNGKTGFCVRPLTRDELDGFDPFLDAVVFDSRKTLKVRLTKKEISVPRFRIGDKVHGPFQDEVVELPTAASIFLLSKGMATIE